MHFKISYSNGESSFSYEINSSDGDLDAIFIGMESFITTICEIDDGDSEDPEESAEPSKENYVEPV